jgi:hypothetical protein
MATNGHSGYPLKWFKDQNAARHAYECAICLEVLKDPVQVRLCETVDINFVPFALTIFSSKFHIRKFLKSKYFK